jgi:hypothetical protein
LCLVSIFVEIEEDSFREVEFPCDGLELGVADLVLGRDQNDGKRMPWYGVSVKTSSVTNSKVLDIVMVLEGIFWYFAFRVFVSYAGFAGNVE